MIRIGVAGLVLGVLVLFPSCSGTDTKSGESSGDETVKRPLTVEPGALEGSYLKLLWTYEHNKEIAGLYYSQGTVLFVTKNNELIKLNPVTGLPSEHILRLKGKLSYPPVVYRYTGEAAKTANDEIFLVQEGDTLWCVEADSMLELWAEDLGYGVACAPCVGKDHIFIAAEGGRINSMRKDSRTEGWTYSAEQSVSAPLVLEQTAQVTGAPSGDGSGGSVVTSVREADYVYAASEDNNLYRLNVYVGWKAPDGTGGSSWVGATKAKIMTSPVSYMQRVFAASLDYTLYAFEQLDGVLAWKYHVGRYVREQPFACRQTVFVVAEESDGGVRTMYAVDGRAGTCRWKRTVQGAGRTYQEDGVPGVGKFLAPGKELVYVLAQDAPEIWGIRITDGTIVHRIPLTAKPDFVVSHDAEHGRDTSSLGLILMATKDGRIVALQERRVYVE